MSLAARFGLEALLAEIADGAVARELERDALHALVRRLAEAGVGAARLPIDAGGWGLDLPELFALIGELAAADANIAHLLRGHFAYVEILLLRSPSPARDAALAEVASGAIVGNAASELTGNSLADITTTLREADGRLVLDGRKFYSTGTLYASHVYVAADRDGDRVTLVVRTDAPGVTVLDDWDGIGQRLTASGTTLFAGVEVDPATVARYDAGGPSHLGGFFQLVLVAVAAGIAEAVLRDAVGFVRPRTRTYITANAELPREDPQIQAVIGQLSTAAFSTRAAVDAAARAMQTALDAGSPADLIDAAEIAAYQAQAHVLPTTLAAATELFEVGGASATARPAALDRHWRNARTVASHNPLVYKHRQIGEWELNGLGPNDAWRGLGKVGATRIG